MKQFIVLYRQEKIMAPADPPFGFACHADDSEHAEEQCLNAEPDADVVWIYEGTDMQRALKNYWTQGMEG